MKRLIIGVLLLSVGITGLWYTTNTQDKDIKQAATDRARAISRKLLSDFDELQARSLQNLAADRMDSAMYYLGRMDENLKARRIVLLP